MSDYSLKLSEERAERRAIMRSMAEQMYLAVCIGGRLGQIWGALTRRGRRLIDLNTVTRSARIVSSHYTGIQQVPLERISGSEGRTNDFDVQFRPLQNHSQSRWVRVALAESEGLTLPPVELVQIGNEYFVRDGHHRVSVARASGQHEIAAQVTVWEVEEVAPAAGSHTIIPAVS